MHVSAAGAEDIFHIYMKYITKLMNTYLLTSLLHGAEFFLRSLQFSAIQETPRILWNLKVHYPVYKCLAPVPILSQINPVCAPPHPTS